MTEKRVPKLRFREFRSNWSKKKLELYTYSISSGKTKPNNVGDYPVYGSMGIIGYTPEYTHEGKHILIARVGANAGFLNLVYGQFSVTDNTLILVLKNSLDIHFAYYLLNKINLNLLAFGSGQPLVTATQLKNLEIWHPLSEEQQKIADYLSCVDEKISLLQKQKNAWKTYKKGVMQQIFSQKVRFKDDNGQEFPEWEEKKLGEIAKFSKGKGISKDDVTSDGQTPCIRYGELYTHYTEVIDNVISYTNIDNKDLVFSKGNDLIIPSSGETHIDIATASCVMNSGVALGGDLNIIKTKHYGVFLAYYLNNAKKNDIARLAQGSSVIHLYEEGLKKLSLRLPHTDEQQKIADFLSSLDDKITALDKQISSAQRWKKGLMQQMFV